MALPETDINPFIPKYRGQELPRHFKIWSQFQSKEPKPGDRIGVVLPVYSMMPLAWLYWELDVNGKGMVTVRGKQD